MSDEAERVVAAAVRQGGLTVTLPPPARHHSIMHPLFDLTGQTVGAHQQGFITSSGRFVPRDVAFQVARKAGQFDPENRKSGVSGRDLYSEDLW